MCKIAYLYKLIVKCVRQLFRLFICPFFSVWHRAHRVCLSLCANPLWVSVHRLGKFTMTLNYHNNHKTNRLAAPIYPFYEASKRAYKWAHTRLCSRLYVRSLLRAEHTFAIVNCTSVTKPIIFRSVFNSIYVSLRYTLCPPRSLSLSSFHPFSFSFYLS